ncbi:Uncharacterized membrane protein [Dyella jiangningensis]|nr:putative membrane protein [Dyella sp. AtDHG13]SDK80074.1 Uncharacterized membrane protein [Dyella jiangningensis]
MMPMPFTSATRPSRRTQRGATAVGMLLMLLFMISMLGIVEVGYLYWAKRDTQKVADLAALAGAQQLSACTPGNANNTAAYGNAYTENKFTKGTLSVQCGTWDPVANAGVSDHFSATAAGSTPNAVKVVAQRPVLPIWGFAGALPSVSAEAVAAGQEPTAVFSIGSTLATVSGKSPLGQALAAVGLNIPEASLVGYQGLANATITPSGLLNQLGVQLPTNLTAGGLNQFLASSVQAHALIDVLNATVIAAGQKQLVNANATLVNAVTAAIGSAPGQVTLGSNGTTSGLFAQITAPDSAGLQSALNAQVSALQLISTAIAVASGQHALSGNLSTPANAIPGLNISTAFAVIEPPQIGIGGVGATASTAQVRAFVHVQLSSSSVPLIGTLLSPLATISLDLPIAIDLVNAQATVASLCTKTDGSPETATFNVKSSILQMCVGGISQASAFSTAGSCAQIPITNNNPLLTVKTGTATLASVGHPFTLTGLTSQGTGTLAAGQSANIPSDGTPLDIGSAVSNLFTALTTALITQSTTPSNSSTISLPLATDLWNNNAAAHTGLTPNLNQLQAALNQLSSSTAGLQGFLQNTTSQVGNILGSTLTLNVPGLLTGTSNVLGGVVNLLGGIVTQTGCALGGQSSCIAAIQTAMNGGTTALPNSLVAVLGFVVQALQGPLNNLGSQVLTPLLTNALGINLGVSTVTLQSLQCHGVQLVY